MIADLGAGTGKLSRQLGERTHRVTSIDSSKEMLVAVSNHEPNVLPVVACVERLPLRNSCMDAAVAGQSFHWFDAGPALAEIHRVLKPQGGLGLLWNRRDLELEWVQHIESLVRPYRRDAPLWHQVDWTKVLASHSGFTALQKQDFFWERALTPEEVATTVSSRSYIAALSFDLRMQLMKKTTEAAAFYQREDGSLCLPFTTHAYWCFKADE